MNFIQYFKYISHFRKAREETAIIEDSTTATDVNIDSDDDQDESDDKESEEDLLFWIFYSNKAQILPWNSEFPDTIHM